MNDTQTLDVQFHIQRRGKNKVLVEGKEPPKPPKPKGRVPRITRYMALAIYFEGLIRNYAEIATQEDVNKFRSFRT